MKRMIIAFLIIAISFSFFACSKTAIPEAETVLVIETEAPSTTEMTAVPETEPPKEIHWTLEHYVDDFGDSTDETYIRGVFEGTFSNTATSGSRLTACLYLDEKINASWNMLTIRLLEYGNSKVNFIGCDSYDVKVKVKIDGEVFEDTADYILADTGEIVMMYAGEVFMKVLRALEKDKVISFVITVNKYGIPNTYRFDVDANGLSDIAHTWILL